MDVLMGSSATPLCFSREDFTRSDFNVESFLTSLRRQVAIEQIQEDLRMYLKILQNAMIELINQDYADFVNLSSNLVNMRVTLEKLGKDVGSVSNEFSASTKELESALESLSGYLSCKNSSQKLQMKLEQKSQMFSAFSRIQVIIQNKQSSSNVIERASQLLIRVRTHMKSLSAEEDRVISKSAFDKLCGDFQLILDEHMLNSVQQQDSEGFKKALDGYDACDRRDSALALFMSEFVKPSLREKLEISSRIPHEKLEAVFNHLFKVWEEQTAFLRFGSAGWDPHEDPTRELHFINDSLLTVLLEILDKDFASILIPTDPDAFHKSYTSLLAFKQKWNYPNHSLLRMALNKFSLTVYFRLRCQEITRSPEKILSSTSSLLSRGEDNAALLEATQSTVSSIAKLWSDSVYIPQLLPKLWDATCKLIYQYKGWLERVIAQKQSQCDAKSSFSRNSAPNSGGDLNPTSSNGNVRDSSQGSPISNGTIEESSWKDVILLLIDGVNVESLVFEIVFEQVWPKIKKVGGNTTAMGQCLSSGFQEIKLISDKGVEFVVSSLSSEMSASLTIASEIPRQYRWTRKEAPTQPSSYIEAALQVLSAFKTYAEEKIMPEETQQEIIVGVLKTAGLGEFLQNVRNVLDSVDKISSSLSRLKKGSTARLASSANLQQQGNDGSARPMTDDQKIKHQLWLDLTEFKDRANELLARPADFDWTPLNHLLDAAGKTEESPAAS